jgi:hypothetical protein
MGGTLGIGADDTPCKRDRVSGGEDAEGIRQRQQNHRSFEEVDEVITEHVLSPSDLCDPYAGCGISPFPDLFAPCHLFPDLIAFSCRWPKPGQKRLWRIPQQATAMNRKRSLQAFSKMFLSAAFLAKWLGPALHIFWSHRCAARAGAVMALPGTAVPASQRKISRPQNRRSSMRTLLRVAVLAIAFLPLAGAQAQSQGSNQAADNALNWAAAGGHYGGAYARYGYARHYHRRHWR